MKRLILFLFLFITLSAYGQVSTPQVVYRTANPTGACGLAPIVISPTDVSACVGNLWEIVGGGSGSGDVVGPASSVNTGIATFNGTTGKLIQSPVGATVDSSGKIGATALELSDATKSSFGQFLGLSSGSFTIQAADAAGTDKVLVLPAAAPVPGQVRGYSGTTTCPTGAPVANCYVEAWITPGNVVGPASAVATGIVTYNGTTGKLIQSSTGATVDSDGDAILKSVTILATEGYVIGVNGSFRTLAANKLFLGNAAGTDSAQIVLGPDNGSYPCILPTGGSAAIRFRAAGGGCSSGGRVETGDFRGDLFSTTTNCSSSASPAVCGAAASGSIRIAAGAASTLVVNTTAVTLNSVIILSPDYSLNTKLGITCNTDLATVGLYGISARSAGVSFTIAQLGTTITNGACFNYFIIN